MLFKKMLRTLFVYKAQFISMVILIALGIGIFAGFNGEWYTIEKDTFYFYEETNFSDYRIVRETGFSSDDLDKVLNIDGVDKATRYLEILVQADDGEDVVALDVCENFTVSNFMVMSGEEYDPTSTDGVWLSDLYAKSNDINIGDNIDFNYKNNVFIFKVKGLIKASEHLICLIDDNQVMPDYNSYGYAYISPAAFKEKVGMEFYSQINVISDLDKKEFGERADKAFGETMQVISKDDVVSYSEAQGEADEGKTMGSILPVIFIIIAVLTMVTTMHRLTTNEKTQIGILKALGFKDRKVIFHYTSFALFIGILGSILGIILGFFFNWFIMNPKGAMGTYFDMPSWKLYFPWFVWMVIVLVVALITFIGYLSIKKILTGTPADALRPYTPKKMKNLYIEKTKWFHKKGFATRWNLRDMFRYKSRTLMTIFGVVGCTLLLFASFGALYSMKSFSKAFIDEPNKYLYKINLSEEITKSEALDLANEYEGDYSSSLAIKVNGETYQMNIYSLKTNNLFLINDDYKNTTIKSDGVYVCSRFAEENNLDIGSEFEFSIFGSNVTYKAKVAGKIKSLANGCSLTYEYADEIGIDYTIQSIYTSKENVEKSNLISSIQSKKAVIDSFDSFLVVMYSMLSLLVIVSVILGIVTLYNLGVMSYMERYRELATLKVLGFRDRKITNLLITQNVWITIIGLLIGMPLGYLALNYLIKALASDYEMKIVLDPRMFIYTTILVFGVSLIVSFMVSRKNKHINMVESLKAE